ncbi:indoleacetamide hydrolase [Pseudoteredinibacter isoporae]|uniref:Mandelamide amidase n=2 Tax=Pseudoteredinibacter isoporae TaxID=570281 RepID=A0A7X0MUD2_9GAMM|nr:indoleacetamide hydrolase [Pseudoteredinibacter isoporae]MBB6520486.1 mandelamide amidase [Pseudoteredinibacter isoporae]NHO86053.1 indoleacetamide hydrolase [Pseudoteredinibacter isoporae]NIB25496.1 indoleacetamide hydrolase [Pseudoteredinibacter isoporae]
MKKRVPALLFTLMLGACEAMKEPQALHEAERVIAEAKRQQLLNAMVFIDEKKLKRDARALDQMSSRAREALPLAGMALVIKDNIHVAGMPNTAGTPGLKDFVPQQDAEVVKRLREAGALIVGKSNLHELAYGITSNNHFTGPVQNPAKAGYFAGGSSGGTAAAVAAGIVGAGLGTDTGGSTRIPAALTGIVGFRPSMGRYPNEGMTMISQTRDTAGPMAIDVATVAKLDAVLAGEKQGELQAPLATTIRLGVARDYFYQNLEPAVAKGIETALSLLAQSGVELFELSAAELTGLNHRVSFPVVLYETTQLLPAYLQANDIAVSAAELTEAIQSPDVKAVLRDAFAGAISETQYQEAMRIHRPALQAYYQRLFEEHQLDALVFPTTGLTARPIKGSEQTVSATPSGSGPDLPTFPSYIQNTDPASNVGSPAISLPIGRSAQGLPMGLELDGPTGSDRKLLAIAARVEDILKELNH